MGIDGESKAYCVYWPAKRHVSVERNVTFAALDVIIAGDMLDKGQSNGSTGIGTSTDGAARSSDSNNTNSAPTVNDNNNTNSTPIISNSNNTNSAPNDTQPISTPPSALEPRTTQARPALGYYSRLQKGKTTVKTTI
ncbi:hypothetical protein BDR04DRAFT_1150995 [Suillus decipiens]|nr:hypothetical protein BDR04DRAFT_1150995 [Suillus decipiens]